MAYIGLIPCRRGSERVVNKNTRPFGGFEGGLLELKLRQMSGVLELERIIVSSNDPLVLDYTAGFAARHDPRFEAVPRPDHLGSSATTMDEYILYAADLCREGTLVWTHVTSPFIRGVHYSAAIAAYERALTDGHDSLVSVTRLQKFIWDQDGPVNYDPTVLRWPRSQDLRPLFEINHAVYIMPFALMRERQDRVGRKPFFHETAEHDALDIDWDEQFHFLDRLMRFRRAEGEALL